MLLGLENYGNPEKAKTGVEEEAVAPSSCPAM
jgi:hypothetical protein